MAITTFYEAVKIPETKIIPRVRVARRWVNSGTDAYADFLTITSYLLENGIGGIQRGVDDQNWIVGKTRIPSADFSFDNSQRTFNENTDVRSLWYDSTLTYYINNSIIEVWFLAELNGTVYAQSVCDFRGLIKVDTLKHDSAVCRFTAVHEIERLKNIPFSSINGWETPFTNRTARSNCSVRSFIQDVKSYLPFHGNFYAMSISTNSPRTDLFFYSTEKENSSVYDVLEDFAQKTGSLFGVQRDDQIYVSYFGNDGEYVPSQTSFVNSGCMGYYNFSQGIFTTTATITAKVADRSGNGRDLQMVTSGTASWPQYAMIGGCRRFGETIPTQYQSLSGFGRAFTMTASESTAGTTIEALFNIRESKTQPINWNQLTLTASNFLQFYNTNSFTVANRVPALINIGYGKDYKLKDYASMSRWSDLQESKNFPVGDNQWVYYAAVNDPTNNERRYYINGFLHDTISGAANLATPATATGGYLNFLTSMYSFGGGVVDFDEMRVMPRQLTAQEIKDNANRLFGNKKQWLSTTVYDFYNYGRDRNIYGVTNYDLGYSKLYNKIKIPQTAPLIYKTMFEISATAAAAFTTITTIIEGNQTVITWSSLDDLDNKLSQIGKLRVERELSSSVTFTVYLDDSDDVSAGQSLIRIYESRGFNSNAYYSPRGNSFFKKETQETNYVYINTASVLAYGTRELELSTDFLSALSLTQVAISANIMLDTYATPKKRITIKAPFKWGNIDVLDRVRLNYKPDYYHETGSDNYYDAEYWKNSYQTPAGGIPSISSDFYVIGITDDCFAGYSEYQLREV